jgi:hypothetical protein
MSLEQGAAAATSSPDNDARYPSFAELRAAHLRLKDSYSVVRTDGATALAIQIRQFLTKAQNTGAILTDPGIRRAAQSVLDYWSAELAGLPGAKTEDFVPCVLTSPKIATLPDVEQPVAEGAQLKQSKEEQRALIRFSGMARQWRANDRKADYLLTGEALQQARPLADQDTDLKELVDASDAAEKARQEAEKARHEAELARIRKRKRFLVYGSLSVSLAVAIVGGLLFWQIYGLPEKSKSWIRQIKETNSSEVQANQLWWLAALQRWLPPYDFSGTRKLTNITLEGLKLNAPNFSQVELTGVWFKRANLTAASFNQARIAIDATNKDRPWNEFSKAELKLTQYGRAEIISTSFAGADLYRAVFDRALLCDVNFSRADLQSASFWGATLDNRTYGWLRKTAWWVAVGWNSHDLERLLNPQDQHQSDQQDQTVVYTAASMKDAQALREALRSSDRFQTEIEKPIAETRKGTFGRALALNDMAWTLAIWGIDPKSLPKESRSLPAETDACSNDDHPKDALEAANQAVCIIANLKAESLKNRGDRDSWFTILHDIIEKLKNGNLKSRESQENNNYDVWLTVFRDTQAYLLMQADRMQEARELYEKDKFLTESDGGMLFRYAVALFATGQVDLANEKFDEAINQKQYLPGDELQNLNRHIPIRPVNIRKMASDALDAAYPSPKPVPSCPEPAKPG